MPIRASERHPLGSHFNDAHWKGQLPGGKYMRVIQVGVGGMGNAWTPVLAANSDIEIAGMVDVNPEVLAEKAEQYEISMDVCFTNFDEALAKVACDAVVLITPPAFHAPQAIAAAKAGKHVLTEKPLSDTLEAAKAMVDACEQAGVTLMVSQNYRRNGDAMTVRSAFQGGVIGSMEELGHVNIEFFKAVDFGATNFRTLMQFPLLLDMGIHHVDLLRYVTAADVVSVYARSFLPSWSWYKHDPGLAMTFELSNGAIGSYMGCWCAGGKETPWSGAWRLQGPKGALLWNGGDISFAPTGTEDIMQIPTLEFPLTGIPMVVDEFVKAVGAGREPQTSGRDNLKSIGIQFAALESIRRNAPVTLAELGV